MKYKKLYTDEELDGLIQWFKDHFDQLPESLYIDKATYVKDLKHTVVLYFDILNDLRTIPCYGAQIRHLFLMKDAVEREWKKASESQEQS